MNKTLFSVLGTIVLVLPVLTHAQYFGEVDSFFTNVTGFIDDVLIPLVFTVALLVFLWGMFTYFIQGGASDDSREKGRQLILWSVIGFVLMVSIWGIVNIVASGLFGNTQPPEIPGTPTVGGSVAPYQNYGASGPQ